MGGRKDDGGQGNDCLLCQSAQSFSHVQLSAAPWTVAHQAPLSLEFSRQEYWSGLPFPPPGDRPDAGIKPMSLVSPALTGRFFTTSPPGPILKHFSNRGTETFCH